MTDTPVPETADTETPDVLDEGWEHVRIDFLGDTLAARMPTQQALAGYSLSASKYVPTEVKTDMTGLFITQHLGPESYRRVMSRLMDPDDPEYDIDTIGALMREIVQLRIDAVEDGEGSSDAEA